MIELPIITGVNGDHPLAKGLVTWWLHLPHLAGGKYVYDLTGSRHGTFDFYAARPAWSTSKRRPGALAQNVDFGTGYTYGGRVKWKPPTAASNPYMNVRNQGDYTASIWCRITVASNPTSGILGISDDGFNGWGLLFYRTFAGEWIIYACSGTPILTGTPVPLNAWTHLAVTRKSLNCNCYMNGRRVYGPVAANGTRTASAEGISVGNYESGTGILNYQLQGAFDDVRYYNRALSAGEVWALYDESRRGCPELLRRARVPVGRLAAPAGPVLAGPTWQGSPEEWGRVWSGSPAEWERAWPGGPAEWERTWREGV